jgi:hypothetical protein
MVESNESRMNRWCRLAGGCLKPPNGAVFKRHGAERLGNDYVMSIVRYG